MVRKREDVRQMQAQLGEFFGRFGVEAVVDDRGRTIAGVKAPPKPRKPLVGFSDTVRVGDHVCVTDHEWTKTKGVVITGTLAHYDLMPDGSVSLYIKPDPVPGEKERGRMSLMLHPSWKHRRIIKLP